MAQSKIKIKIVEFINGLMAGKPKQYKPALQTPTVVSAEKFIENIAKETGLSKFQANNVLSCIFQTAGDYMELGNAVQLHEDFGTLKPYIKVKAVSDKDKCNAECVLGMGLRLIPTGKMRSILGGAQFVFIGMSNGSDVEESEVVDPNDPNNNPGNDPQGGGQQGGGGGQQQTATTYTLTLKKANNTVISTTELEAGATITYPTATAGYMWPADAPTVMPAEATTVTEVVDDDPNVL